MWLNGNIMVNICRRNNDITQSHKIFSVTEDEVTKALLKYDKRDSSCLAFCRHLDNINLGHRKAWRYIDQGDDGSVNTEAQGELNWSPTLNNIYRMVVPL